MWWRLVPFQLCNGWFSDIIKASYILMKVGVIMIVMRNKG